MHQAIIQMQTTTQTKMQTTITTKTTTLTATQTKITTKTKKEPRKQQVPFWLTECLQALNIKDIQGGRLWTEWN